MHQLTPEEYRTIAWSVIALVCFCIILLLTVPKDFGMPPDDKDDDGPPPPIFPMM